MSSLLALPNELLDPILDHFSTDEYTDKIALNHLALTHSSLLPRAQARLFHRVCLNFAWGNLKWVDVHSGHLWDPEYASKAPSTLLANVLRVSPRLGTYIKELHLENGALTDVSTTEVISHLTSLQSISLVAPFTLHWDNSDRELHEWSEVEVKDALVEKVFPKISSLHVQGFRIFPFHEVIPCCINLKDLATYDMSNDGDVGLQGTSQMSHLSFPPLKALRFAVSARCGRTLLNVVEQTCSTLEELWLGSRLSEQVDLEMVYERRVMSLVGPMLTSLTLTLKCFSNYICPGSNSRAFHLQSLPCLREFGFTMTSLLSREANFFLEWIITRFSDGHSPTHPLARVCIKIVSGDPPYPVQHPERSALWNELDATLSSFKQLEKLILYGLLRIRRSKELDAWRQEQAMIASWLPTLTK
ncbi:hypothetical protein DL96DRAFT_1687927 [Flagelloscypha sp. PMI_526]|nr:hypothetical protein DL96DRAFT_1687927 [Flagelloscypha sp. PMI_526]